MMPRNRWNTFQSKFNIQRAHTVTLLLWNFHSVINHNNVIVCKYWTFLKCYLFPITVLYTHQLNGANWECHAFCPLPFHLPPKSKAIHINRSSSSLFLCHKRVQFHGLTKRNYPILSLEWSNNNTNRKRGAHSTGTFSFIGFQHIYTLHTMQHTHALPFQLHWINHILLNFTGNNCIWKFCFSEELQLQRSYTTRARAIKLRINI